MLSIICMCILVSTGYAIEDPLQSDCESVYKGAYLFNKCFFLRSVVENWTSAMDSCNAMGRSKYSGHAAHILSSLEHTTLKHLSPNVDTYLNRSRWLGIRDALPGPDVNKTYWKFRSYYSSSAYDDQPINTLYFGINVEHAPNDPHHHTDAALFYLPDHNQFADTLIKWERISYCQINGNTKIYDVTGSNRRVVPPSMLHTSTVTSLIECQQKCVNHAICLGFNIGPCWLLKV